MAQSKATQLAVSHRDPGHSRETRRLRRAGQVPGVVYGGGVDPISFSVEERTLRHALAARGAVIELSVDGETVPVVLKDIQRHPVRGDTVHVDLLRVDLSKPIQQPVPVHLIGADDAPGVRNDGGVLEQVTREVNVEALPSEIPEFVELDVSAMEVNDTIFLNAITPPSGVTLLDDLDETVIASLAPPRVDDGGEEIESETELVGESGSAAQADGADDAGDDSSGEGSGGE